MFTGDWPNGYFFEAPPALDEPAELAPPEDDRDALPAPAAEPLLMAPPAGALDTDREPDDAPPE